MGSSLATAFWVSPVIGTPRKSKREALVRRPSNQCAAYGEINVGDHVDRCRLSCVTFRLFQRPFSDHAMSQTDWLNRLLTFMDGIDLIALGLTNKPNRRALYWPPAKSIGLGTGFLHPLDRLTTLLGRLRLDFLPDLLRRHNLELRGSMILQALIFNVTRATDVVNPWNADVDLAATDSQSLLAAHAELCKILSKRSGPIINMLREPDRMVLCTNDIKFDLVCHVDRKNLGPDMLFLDNVYDGHRLTINHWENILTRSSPYRVTVVKLYDGDGKSIAADRIAKYQKRGFHITNSADFVRFPA